MPENNMPILTNMTWRCYQDTILRCNVLNLMNCARLVHPAYTTIAYNNILATPVTLSQGWQSGSNIHNYCIHTPSCRETMHAIDVFTIDIRMLEPHATPQTG